MFQTSRPCPQKETIKFLFSVQHINFANNNLVFEMPIESRNDCVQNLVCLNCANFLHYHCLGAGSFAQSVVSVFNSNDTLYTPYTICINFRIYFPFNGFTSTRYIVYLTLQSVGGGGWKRLVYALHLMLWHQFYYQIASIKFTCRYTDAFQ